MEKSAGYLTITALMTAVICILGPFTIPIGPIPLSLSSLGIYLAVLLLGRKNGSLSVLLYLLIGLAGIPVFSGFSAGAGKLFGPTGGYLLGYLLLAVVSGWFLEQLQGKSRISEAIALGVGTICMYIPGAVWLGIQSGMDFSTIIISGVLLFVPGDMLKISVAILLGKRIKTRVNSGFFTKN